MNATGGALIDTLLEWIPGNDPDYPTGRHLSIPDLLLMNTAVYEGLTDAERKTVDQAARETQVRQRVLWAEDETKALATLKAAGMEFNDVDAAAFAERAAAIYETYYRKYGEPFKRLCEDIRGVK